eukprot:GILI01001728.1.p1 GENE.GILI01001728.1~~GILI01001728.1.p1  ORF type:complete len:499 (-),score=93.05 GILI01001728.1:441-1937(-)
MTKDTEKVASSSPKTASAKSLARFFEGLHSFKNSPRELWIVFILKFLESYAYFAMSYTLIIYLSEEFGFTDEQAGWTYGLFSTLISVYGCLIGSVIDNLGVRWSLVIGGFLLCCGRFVIALTTNRHILTWTFYTLLPVGSALGIPVMNIAIRRYTTDQNRSLAFSLYYIMMNIAAFCAAPVIDFFRHHFKNNLVVEAFGSTHHLTPYRLLLLSGCFMTLTSLTIASIFVREINVDEEENLSGKRPGQIESPLKIMWEVVSKRRFWRFLLFVAVLLGVRTIFRHLDATFPKYMLREFGREVLFGTIISLNPLLVVIVATLLVPWTLTIPAFDQIVIGTFISGVSPFFLTLGASYTTAIAFVAVLSIGEAIWSPRLYEYTVQVAERGREGTYMALASAPMFMATLLTGLMSGKLLSAFCPAHGPRHSEYMWMVVGVISMSSPILLLLFRTVIHPDSATNFFSWVRCCSKRRKYGAEKCSKEETCGLIYDAEMAKHLDPSL